MRAAVLGAGLVGGPMAVDLAREEGLEVTAFDVDEARLARLGARGIATEVRDLSDADGVRDLAAGFDLVVSAVPGFMGYATLEAILQGGTPAVDIAFFPEDPFALDGLARAVGVPAIVDCGVAPGMSNLLVGYADHLLARTDRARIFVGGLPVERREPWQYKAVFSPVDVLEEYIRPARYVEGGQVVTRPALGQPEYLEFAGVGTLEAFDTDGLRSVMHTVDCPDMKEKTLRYPGYREKVAFLRDLGFLSEEPVDVGGRAVRPLDLTAALLLPQWKLEEGEADLTVMRVIVEGETPAGARVRHTWDLDDRYDPTTGVHSMARTTGYTATVAARLVARGLYTEPGICPPELLGRRPEVVEFMLAGLAARGVVFAHRVEALA